MAKIKKLPGLKVINGFKGTLDFYVHCGQVCVRSWPRSPGHDRAPAVEARWPAFAWAASYWNYLDQSVRQAYIDQATGTYMTGRDIFVKNFIHNKTLELE